MDRFIVEESGFPKDRPTLQKFQEQFTVPIDKLLGILPNTMVLEGCVVTDTGGGNISVTAGLLMRNGFIYTLEAYAGPNEQFVSYYENTSQATFNVGTFENPNEQPRDFKIVRTAKMGSNAGLPGYIGRQLISQWQRNQKIPLFLARGTTAVGAFAQRTALDIPIAITFPEVSTASYVVIGDFRPVNPADSLNEPINWLAKNKTKTGFNLVVRPVSGSTPNLYFSYILLTLI